MSREDALRYVLEETRRLLRKRAELLAVRREELLRRFEDGELDVDGFETAHGASLLDEWWLEVLENDLEMAQLDVDFHRHGERLADSGR